MVLALFRTYCALCTFNLRKRTVKWRQTVQQNVEYLPRLLHATAIVRQAQLLLALLAASWTSARCCQHSHKVLLFAGSLVCKYHWQCTMA